METVRDYHRRENHDSLKESKILLISCRRRGIEVFEYLHDYGIKNIKVLDYSELDVGCIDIDNQKSIYEVWNDCSSKLRWVVEEIMVSTNNNTKSLLETFSSFHMVISTLEGNLGKRINRLCAISKVPLLELETATTLRNVMYPLLKEAQSSTPSKSTSCDNCNTLHIEVTPSLVLLAMTVNFFSILHKTELHSLATNSKKQQGYLDKIIENIPSYYTKDSVSLSPSEISISPIAEQNNHAKNLQDILLETFKRKLELYETKSSSLVDDPSPSTGTEAAKNTIIKESDRGSFLRSWRSILQASSVINSLYTMLLVTCSLPQSALLYIYQHLLSTLKPTEHEVISIQLFSLLSWLRCTIQYRGLDALMKDILDLLEVHKLNSSGFIQSNTLHRDKSFPSSSSLLSLTSPESLNQNRKSLVATTLFELYHFCKTLSTFPLSLDTLNEEELTRQLSYHLLSIISPRLRNLSVKEIVYLETLLIDAENWIELYGGYQPFGYVYQVSTSFKKAVPNMTGHSGGITALLALPNGQFFSSAQDKTMKLWNPRMSEVIYTVDCHHAVVTAMILLSEDWLAVGYDTGGISVYSISTKMLMKELSGHTKKITSLTTKVNRNIPGTFSLTTPLKSATDIPTPKHSQILLLSASEDCQIKIWNIDTGECIHRYHQTAKVHCMMVASIPTHPSATSSPAIPLNSFSTPITAANSTTTTHITPLVSTFVTPMSVTSIGTTGNNNCRTEDEEEVILTGSDHGLLIYRSDNPDTGKQLNKINAVVFSFCALSNQSTYPKQLSIVIGCYGYILLYNVTRDTIVKKVSLGNVPIYSICCMPSMTATLLGKNTAPNSVDSPVTTCSSTSTSSNDLHHSIVMGGEDGHLYQYNIVKERIIAMKKASGIITSIIIIPTNQLVLYATQDDYNVHTWSIANDSTPSVRPWSRKVKRDGFSDDINQSNVANSLSINDSPSSSISTLGGHTKYITFLKAMSKNRLLSASQDNTLCIWDLATGHCLRTLVGHIDTILCAIELPSRLRIASGGGSYDKAIRLWHTETGECVGILNGHSLRVLCLCTFPNLEDFIASGSADRSIMVWNLQSMQCIHIFEGHRNNITTLLGTTDAQLISIAKHDPIVHLWQCQLQSADKYTCSESKTGDISLRHLELHDMKHFDRTDYIIALFQLADGRLVIEGNHAIFILTIPTTTQLHNARGQNISFAKKMFFLHENARILAVEKNIITTINLDHTTMTKIYINPHDYELQTFSISTSQVYQYIQPCYTEVYIKGQGESFPSNVYLNTNRIKDILPYHTDEEIVGYFIAKDENTIVLTGLKGELHFTKLLSRKKIYDERFPLVVPRKWLSVYSKNDQDKQSTSSSGEKEKITDEEEYPSPFHIVDESQEEIESIENVMVLLFWMFIMNLTALQIIK